LKTLTYAAREAATLHMLVKAFRFTPPRRPDGHARDHMTEYGHNCPN
jgi:hypothetical protein